MTIKMLGRSNLAVVALAALVFGSVAAGGENWPTDPGSSTGATTPGAIAPEGCKNPHDGDPCGPCCDKGKKPNGTTIDAPDSLPALGEPVELLQIAGEVPDSTQWTGVPNFGTARYLSWMPMVYLQPGNATSWDASVSAIKRDYAQVLYPASAKVVAFPQCPDSLCPLNIQDCNSAER